LASRTDISRISKAAECSTLQHILHCGGCKMPGSP
jgi:hypothetical protein